MNQQPMKKLELKKKTITRLNEAQLKQMEGGSYYTTVSIIVFSAGCATDFTRPRTIITSGVSGISG